MNCFSRTEASGCTDLEKVLLVHGNDSMSVVITLGESSKIQKLHRLVAGVDVGVNGGRIRRQHVCHPWLLDSQLRSQQHETGTVDRGPYFFLSGAVRMRFAHGQRI